MVHWLTDYFMNQGTLTLSVPDARGPIVEAELQERFGAYGDVKAIFVNKTRPNERYIEFYDSRVSPSLGSPPPPSRSDALL